MSENYESNIQNAVNSLKNGHGIIVLDDEDRENEGDLIFACSSLQDYQVAQMIKDCSGIICLVLDEERAKYLNLPFMTDNNQSKNHTNFTISIEAAQNVTTGVSASDRLTTIKAAVNSHALPQDIVSPGHVFPLISKQNGVLERKGHTEATYDMMQIAETGKYGVLCELTNPDGTMMKGSQIENYSKTHNIPIVTVENIIKYRQKYSI